MPIRKKGNIEVKTSPNGYGIKRTGYTFYSYDKNSAALYFEFNDQNGQPTDLKKATVRLVMILNDDDRKNASVTTKAEIISELRGTAKYDIPESLLGYEGKVTGYVYLEFEDGSHTDEGQFTFNIKRSMISNVLPEAGDKYVQDFEDVKERVEQAGDSATKDIEKAKDDAESQIGEYVGEVESAKDSTIEDIDKALPEVENKLEDIKGKVSELDISDTNLLTGTSDSWIEETWSSWGSQRQDFYIGEDSLKIGDTLTYSIEIDNTVDDVNDTSVLARLSFYDNNDNLMSNQSASGNYINGGKKGTSVVTDKIPEGTKRLAIFGFYKNGGSESKTAKARKHKLQKGNRATDWTPNPSEVITKKEYDKLAQAIINLGGEI